MITSVPRKKLIEVSIPLEAINRESAAEKQIKVGKPASLHNYWAPRPLAACRAVLFAQLVDDPSSCPEEFPTEEAQDAERDRLHRLIEAIVPWEAARNETLLSAARYEIARSVARSRGEKLPPRGTMAPSAIIDYLQANAPPVYDPFSGGGLIPLEAQRLGLRAIGSDLNPVAVLIGKALVEFPPKFAGRRSVNPEADELRHWKAAEGLADDVRYYGRWMRGEAEKRIGHLYPMAKLKDGKEATVIAWLWARTVPSPDPRANGASVPLASSFVLSSKAGKEVIVRPVVDRVRMEWRFEIDDKPSAANVETAKKGTKAARGANFICLLTGAAIDDVHVKREAIGGRMDAALMAIVAEGTRGRVYLPPTREHSAAAEVDVPEIPEVDQPLPDDPRNFWTVSYGLNTFRNLFTPRQLIALTTFSDLVIQARERVLKDARYHWSGSHADDARPLAEGGLGPVAYADAVTTYLAFAIDRSAQTNTTLCRWVAGIEKIQPSFDRHAVPMTWDFGEANILGPSTGGWLNTIKHITNSLEIWGSTTPGAKIIIGDAATAPLDPDCLVSTDPPYYNNIAYADLSDFFFVWLRRTLRELYPDMFRRVLTPKKEELVATPYRHRERLPSVEQKKWDTMSPAERAELFFLEGMKRTLGRFRAAAVSAPAVVYYAFKETEAANVGVLSPGWATFPFSFRANRESSKSPWPMRRANSVRLQF
jgi:putative DNA methylase